MAAAGSGAYIQSIVAGLMTLGGVHGPLTDTQRLLEHVDSTGIAADLLATGRTVPGWGNSFVKGDEDPAWLPVRNALISERPDLIRRIDAVTRVLHDRGKIVFPNPSAYTAACAIAREIPAEACASLFIAARLTAWTDIYLETIKERV